MSYEFTEEELAELAREKQIADYQEYMHDLEEENQRAREEQLYDEMLLEESK